MIDFILRNSPKQQYFLDLKRLYASKMRYCTPQIFCQSTLNSATRKRKWILYFTSVGRIFCIPCKPFSTSANAFTVGFNDWKNGVRITKHEQSQDFIYKIIEKIQESLWCAVMCWGKQTPSYTRNTIANVDIGDKFWPVSYRDKAFSHLGEKSFVKRTRNLDRSTTAIIQVFSN